MQTLKTVGKDILTEIIKNIKEYYIFIVIIVVYLLAFYLLDPHGPNCLVKRTIGIPCPGCGMTRAVYYLSLFDFKQALYFHPLVFLMPFIILTLLLKGYGIFQKLFHSKVFWGVTLFLFITVYIIRMYLYYPHTPPMDHYFH